MDRMISDEEVVEIGRKLKELREKLMLTQQEFADKLFWDVSSYQKIESGKSLKKRNFRQPRNKGHSK